MKIEDWHAEIDRIDDKLLRLLSRRVSVSTAVARWKQDRGLPLSAPARERAIG